MKNNTLSKVQIDSSKRPRKRFNLAYDVNSTASWGDLQPHVCKFMYPNTKNVLQSESLVRLAPMLAPTFGRVQLKQFHQFVDVEDIYPPFAALMSQTSYTGKSTYVPQCVPRVPLAYLSLFAFAGCRMTCYYKSSADEDFSTATLYYVDSTTLPNGAREAFDNYIGAAGELSLNCHSHPRSNVYSTKYYLPFNYTSGNWFNACGLLSPFSRAFIMKCAGENPTSDKRLLPLYLPIANTFLDPYNRLATGYDFFDYMNDGLAYNSDVVTLEGADYVVQRQITVGSGTSQHTISVYMACRFSSLGKRIRKHLLGLGYQINLESCELVSLLPLMADYKAYYDMFGIQQLNNFEDTTLAKLIQHISFNNYSEYSTRLIGDTLAGDDALWTSIGYLKGLLFDVGESWYTDEQDFVSAHQRQTTFGPRASGDGIFTPAIRAGAVPVYNFAIGESALDKEAGFNADTYNYFTHVDVELLKRLYRWSNSQSVAGKQIADALRAQGYQSYVDSCHSNFIGSDESMIVINDVVSTADTYSSDSHKGAILGEYGGKGIGYSNGDSFVYETDKFGYWIGFFVIVPKSGYSQGIDATLTDTDKFSFYNPEFDGLGFQLDTKSVVCESLSFTDEAHAQTDPLSFGFVPRYSEWKVSKNISNGDFSLRGTRNTYQPYCLDKEIPVGERRIALIDGALGQENTTWSLEKLFTSGDLPVAGQIWRYVGRYPWLGNYDRIFANFNGSSLYERLQEVYRTGGLDANMCLANSYDNFLIHFIVNLQSYAPMLPIEETFGTDDDGSFDSSVNKS